MEIKRFYANLNNFTDGNVLLDGDEFYHMTKVLRHKIGYKIIVSNNVDGKDYYCIITRIDTDSATAEIISIEDNECKTNIKITLYQALPKGDKIDLIVQKAVELGVSDIKIFNSDYVNENKFNLERLNKINIEACKQCGRSRVAEVSGLFTFDEMLLQACKNDLIIFAYEKEQINNIKSAIANNKEINSVAIVIGSEGGFSLEEVEKAKNSKAEIVTLGSRIMRCETASIVCMGIVMYELGEMCR